LPHYDFGHFNTGSLKKKCHNLATDLIHATPKDELQDAGVLPCPWKVYKEKNIDPNGEGGRVDWKKRETRLQREQR
jgi:hypothetical protein